MKKYLKKAIIFSAIFSVLAPQVSFACKKDRDCNKPVEERIVHKINKHTDTFAKKNHDVRDMMRSQLTTYLTNSYNAACDKAEKMDRINVNVHTLGIFTVVEQSKASDGWQDVQNHIMDKVFPWLSKDTLKDALAALGSNAQVTQKNLVEKIIKDSELKDHARKACLKIAKSLGYEINLHHGSCYGRWRYTHKNF